MKVAMEWLAARRPAPPPPLQGAIREALRSAAAGMEAEPVGRALARAGLEALGEVAALPSERTAAPRLLAADALLTYACEAAAEAGPDALADLTRALSPRRFESLLEGLDARGGGQGEVPA